MNGQSMNHDAAVRMSLTLTPLNKVIDTATQGVECVQTTDGGSRPTRL